MIISRTPLRISFAGGGSDIRAYYRHGYGAVLSTAIDKYMYVTVNRTFDHHFRVIYSTVEYVEAIEDIKHNLAREAMRLVGITEGGLDIGYIGDMLPAHAGSGLGGSSTLTVGILNSLHRLNGDEVSAEMLAREACGIEIGTMHRPIGKQDQYAAACGGLHYYRFNSDETVTVEPVDCRPETLETLSGNLMMFYTALDTKSDSILAEQSEKLEVNRPVMDKMVALAGEMRRMVEKDDLSGFGEALHQGWLYKRQLASEMTNPLIDDYYEKARQAGATGGKILGSGGGGFLLFYCEPDKQPRVREALRDLREAPFSFEPEGSKIVYINGA